MAVKLAKGLSFIGCSGAFLWSLELLLRIINTKSVSYEFGPGRVLGSVADFIGAVFLLAISFFGVVAALHLPAEPRAAFGLQVINCILLALVSLIAFDSMPVRQAPFFFPLIFGLFLLGAFLIASILSFRLDKLLNKNRK
jgi:hypothetical protein